MYQFDPIVTSKCGKVALTWNTTISKWEAINTETKKVITRRKNIAVLILELNKVPA
jgi:hypothetical protein